MPANHSSPEHQPIQRADPSGLAEALKQGVLIAIAILALTLPPQRAPVRLPAVSGNLPHAVHQPARQAPRYADFGAETASEDAQYIANWVADSGDNGNLAFVIIDKRRAKVFVFDSSAKIVGATPVLLGAAKGDDSVTGIGQRPITKVRLEERTTPAGRFMGEPGRNASGEAVVWVDYDAAVSMHRVRTGDPKERRLERLATPTSDDNRISYGCINIPVAFFENVLSPVFRGRYGVVYVLPEVKPVRQVFLDAYDPAEKYAATALSALSR